MNNELACFGVSTHDTEEYLPKWSEKALKDIEIVKLCCDNSIVKKLVPQKLK